MNPPHYKTKGLAHRRAVLVTAFFVAVVFLTEWVFLVPHDPILKNFAKENYHPLFDASIKAKSAFVFDVLTSKVLFEKDADVSLPLASIAKIATAFCAIDTIYERQSIKISPSVLGVNQDKMLIPGTVWSRNDLIRYMLIKSSNDAAVALSQTMGGRDKMVSCMNSLAEERKLMHTHFYNETGLDIDTSTPGGFGSAREVSMLAFYAFKAFPFIFASTQEAEYNERGIGINAKNTNRVVDKIFGLQMSKTGYTALAGGNLVLIVNIGLNHPVIVTVLGSTEDGRFEDALLIINNLILSLSQ